MASHGSETPLTRGHAAMGGDDYIDGGTASTARRPRAASKARGWACALFAVAATAAPLAGVLARMTPPRAGLPSPAPPGRSNVSGVASHDFVVVRCESFRLRQVACPAVSAANVKVARVLGGRCIPGLTWFYDRRAIHVRGGCRALFIVGGAAQTTAQPR